MKRAYSAYLRAPSVRETLLVGAAVVVVKGVVHPVRLPSDVAVFKAITNGPPNSAEDFCDLGHTVELVLGAVLCQDCAVPYLLGPRRLLIDIWLVSPEIRDVPAERNRALRKISPCRVVVMLNE